MSDLAKAFAGLKAAAATQEPGPGTQAPKGAGTHGLKLAPLPLDNTAKSRHPEYTAVKVFVRRATHRAARRKWQDSLNEYGGGGDFSDLVERLLQKYLGA